MSPGTNDNFNISFEWDVDGAILPSSSSFLLNEFSAALNP